MSDTPKILYTLTDEAPFLATQSLLPIVDAFTSTAGVAVETRDISLAARIVAQFPDTLDEAQQMPTTWPSWASWPPRRKPTSSSCRTSAPRCRS